MRIPGLGKEILTKQFGVESPSECLSINALGECIEEGSKDIPGYKIKENLSNGSLDAAEWISPHEDMAFDIHKLSNNSNTLWYYYYPGWWEPSTTFNIHINENSWGDNRLCSTYRAILESACSRVFNEILAEYNYENRQALNTLKTEYKNKIEVLPFNREILAASEKGTNEYFDSLPMPSEVDKVFDEWKNFKKNIRVWSKYEAYYTNWDVLDEYY